MRKHRYLPYSFLSTVLGLAVLGSASAGVQAATFTVDRIDDDAAATACTDAVNDCSLRGAISRANADPDEDIIDATGVSGVITLSNGVLQVTTNVTINGPGPGSLAVSGND